MIRVDFGNTGYKISPMVFGGIVNTNESQEDANKNVAYAIEQGINYFDVAPSYGNAEERLGIALEAYRKDVYLACKTMKRDAKSAKEEILNSMKLLKTDHFDVFQLHSMETDEDFEQVFGKDGAMETILWAKREGIIRKIGMSIHNEDVGLKCLENFDFDTILFPMNWASGINKGWGDRISAKAKEKGCGLLGMKTLIHRQWEEGEHTIFPKSWCKPIDNEELAVAAMKYGRLKGCDTLIPPGDFYHFDFMLKHMDQWLQPMTEAEMELLKAEAAKIKGKCIF